VGVEPPRYRILVVARIPRHQTPGGTAVRLVIVDGPEKSGKTTLVEELINLGAFSNHWGPVASSAVRTRATRS
jgi:hypothetical protein